MPTIHHPVGKHTPSQQIKVAFIIPFIVREHKHRPCGPRFLPCTAYSGSNFRMRGSSETDSGGFNCALPWGVLNFFFWGGGWWEGGGLLILVNIHPYHWAQDHLWDPNRVNIESLNRICLTWKLPHTAGPQTISSKTAWHISCSFVFFLSRLIN